MPPNLKRSSATAFALLAGLIAAQIIATVHVYRSGRHLYRQTEALAAAGYLIVPNASTAPQLLQLDSALAGGLFFTLSAGAALSLLTLAAAWLWVHGCARSRMVLCALGLLPAAGLYLVNRNGFNPTACVYLTVVPAVVFGIYVRCSVSRARAPVAAPLIGLAVLAAGWSLNAGPNLFLDVRDTLLLSNPVGIAVNDFYYRNTLFAAEAFKSPGQRIQKPCRLAGETGTADGMLLERSLRNQDCLAVEEDVPVVLTAHLRHGKVSLRHRNRPILEIPLTAMLNRPREALAEFSRAVDRWPGFRTLCYFGVLLAFPILLYTSLYMILKTWTVRRWREPAAAWLATGICLTAGIACLIPAVVLKTPPSDFGAISRGLRADSGLQRDAALKSVARKRMEITDFPAYRHILRSPRPAERYWAARALGVSRNPATATDLLGLLNDPHPNVVCQALAAIGARRIVAAIPRIQALLTASRHWYVQRYAYIALRSLGWTQPALTTAP